VLRNTSRGINLDVVLGNLDSEVRFAVLQNDIVSNGIAIHGRYASKVYLGGVGLAVFEWLHVPGFLEAIIDRSPLRGDPDAHQGSSGGLVLGECKLIVVLEVVTPSHSEPLC
jgi:hypothetical protein